LQPDEVLAGPLLVWMQVGVAGGPGHLLLRQSWVVQAPRRESVGNHWRSSGVIGGK
jgi:hypothetical protein